MLKKRKPTKLNRYPFSVYELVRNLGSTSVLNLTYVNEEGDTATFSAAADTEKELARYNDRLYFNNTNLDEYEPSELVTRAADEFSGEFTRWWARRGSQWGRLMDAFNKEYDPISNYDRHEVGGWSDTNAIGARSNSESATDTYGEKSRTTTETPRVTTTRTVTPDLTETVTETPGVTETTVVTPDLTETITETPGVTDTVTVTPNRTESVTETPRVVTQTVTAPGSSTTTASTIYGDNSSTAVPTGSTTVTNSGSDTVTVTPTGGTNQTETRSTGTETTQTAHTGDNETVTEKSGTERTLVSRTGDNETVTERDGTETTQTSRSGDNETVTERTGSETSTEEFSGSNTTTVEDEENEDTHVKTATSAAATDTLTRLFQNYRVYGNIGVTTSAQMLSGEFELRSAHDLVAFAILEFVNLTTVYC